MKALKITLIVVASLFILGGAGYLYASSGVKSQSGYAKLVAPRGESTNALVSLNIGPGGLAPARWLVEKVVEASDHENDIQARVLSTVLDELKGVQLRVYDVGNNNRQAFDNAINETVTALKKESWETLATVRKEDEHVVVMHSGNDELISGLSIMVNTQDNAVFLNLIGPFDPQVIAEAVSQLN